MNEENPSKEMIEIQVEETLEEESFMVIDSSVRICSHNLLAPLFAVTGLVMILLFTDFPTKHNVISYRLNKTDRTIVWQQQFSPMNRFLFVSARFSGSEMPVFGWHVLLLDEKGNVTRQLVDQMPVANKKEITLTRTPVVDFPGMRIELHFSHVPDNGCSLHIDWLYGTSEFTKWWSAIRLVALLLGLGAAYEFFSSLHASKKAWLLEQKLTAGLLLMFVLLYNPFSLIELWKPSKVFVVLDNLLDVGFSCYLAFFMLGLFASIRAKSRNSETWSLGPELTFMILLFVALVIVRISNSLELFDVPTDAGNQTLRILRLIQAVVWLPYAIYSLVSIILAASRVDETDIHKFVIYLCLYVVGVLLSRVSIIVRTFLARSVRTRIRSCSALALQLGSVLIMERLHRPLQMTQNRGKQFEQDEVTQNQESSLCPDEV